MASTAEHKSQALSEKLQNAFDGSIPRIWKSPLYLFGLILAAALIVLLPVVYLGLIALAGYGVCYYAANHVDLLALPEGVRGRGLVFAALLKTTAYLGPILVGAILILFMVKPLFARPARIERRLSFVPENEPVLFAFVARLCRIIGSPAPRRIDVDCDINAAAGFRRGLLSLFGRDMVLSIGAPIVAGMTLREFTGILAHEFGHFSQGTGMRLTYVISRVNRWFARVVWERDAWDLQLIDLSRAGNWLSFLFLIARVPVWLIRRILWLLMMAGHAISCTMLRQMEYDADQYSIRICGSEAFESATKRMYALEMGWNAAHAFLDQCWKERRLPENLPALIMSQADQLPPEARQQIERRLAEAGTRLLATHPADGARIRRARCEDAPGIFRVDAPAAVLFVDFDVLCREVTFSYYQGLIGSEAGRGCLMPMADVDRRLKVLDETAEAARRYWATLAFVVRPFRVNPYSPVFNLPTGERLARLKRARSAIENSQQTIRKEYDRLQSVDQRISDGRQAEFLLKSGLRIDPKDFGLAKAEVAEAQLVYQQGRRERQAAEQAVGKVEAVFAMRIEAALALLKCDEVAANLEDAVRMRARSERLLDVVAGLHRAEYLITELRLNQNALRAMEDVVSKGYEGDRVIAQTLKILELQNKTLSEIRSVLKEIPYPYEHAGGGVSVSHYAIGLVPQATDLTGTANAVSRALDALCSLYLRVMGELAQVAEKVEAAVGLKPIRLLSEADPHEAGRGS